MNYFHNYQSIYLPKKSSVIEKKYIYNDYVGRNFDGSIFNTTACV